MTDEQEKENLPKAFSALVIISTCNAAIVMAYLSFMRDYFEYTVHSDPESSSPLHFATVAGVVSLILNSTTALIAGTSAALITYHHGSARYSVPFFRIRLLVCLTAQIGAAPALIACFTGFLLKCNMAAGLLSTVFLCLALSFSLSVMHVDGGSFLSFLWDLYTSSASS
ncbi:hypothetical protein EYR40_010654 [Pleurotus pulmonarius]|nr:hypothetical protein EYR36_002428 [Pleurotus pulmonarius]KAF4586640.1 hypothetical protein EYR40_010654 [Pleurotus pulmonarius]